MCFWIEISLKYATFAPLIDLMVGAGGNGNRLTAAVWQETVEWKGRARVVKSSRSQKFWQNTTCLALNFGEKMYL